MKRTDRLKQLATKQGKPASAAIFNPVNLTYFTDFSGATALYIPENGDCTLYVSSVNYEQAKSEAKNANVEALKRGENLMQKIASQNPKKLGVDALSVESWRNLAKAVGGEEKLDLISEVTRQLRSVKDQEEIKRIREACRLAAVGMQTTKESRNRVFHA
jgi:Xaa-Pro dipeptidase